MKSRAVSIVFDGYFLSKMEALRTQLGFSTLPKFIIFLTKRGFQSLEEELENDARLK